MAFSWIRPADPAVLQGRPLLDVGVGDGQTLGALVASTGLVVGMDISAAALRAGKHAGASLVLGQASRLPFLDRSFTVVMAADLFHHLDDAALANVLREAARVCTGRIVAWWYRRPGRPAPDAPRHPREASAVAAVADGVGLRSETLALEAPLATPPTVGLLLRV